MAETYKDLPVQGIGGFIGNIFGSTSDPRGQRQQSMFLGNKMQERQIEGYDFNRAKQQLDLYATMAMRDIQTGKYIPEDVVKGFGDIAEKDPIIKASPVFGNHAKAYIGVKISQAQQAREQKQQKLQYEKTQDFWGSMMNANFPKMSPDAQRGFINQNAAGAGVPTAIPTDNLMPQEPDPQNTLLFNEGEPPILVDKLTGNVTQTQVPAGYRTNVPQTKVEVPITIPGEASGFFNSFDEASDWANKYNADPRNSGRIASALFNTKGMPTVEFKDRAIPSQGERELTSKKKAALQKIEEFESLIDENLTGPIQGRITKLKNNWGVGDTPDSQALEVMAESMIREAYTDAGKQLSDKELRRLVAFFPVDISAADEKFRQQFRIFKDEVMRALEITEDVQESLGLNTGIEVGATATNPTTKEKLKWDGRSWQKVQ
jgi:hypothetical protein